jgi:hypothetical protein
LLNGSISTTITVVTLPLGENHQSVESTTWLVNTPSPALERRLRRADDDVDNGSNVVRCDRIVMLFGTPPVAPVAQCPVNDEADNCLWTLRMLSLSSEYSQQNMTV